MLSLILSMVMALALVWPAETLALPHQVQSSSICTVQAATPTAATLSVGERL